MLLRVHTDTSAHIYARIRTYKRAFVYIHVYVHACARTYLQIRRTGAHKVSAASGRKPGVIVRYLSSEFRYTGYI